MDRHRLAGPLSHQIIGPYGPTTGHRECLYPSDGGEARLFDSDRTDARFGHSNETTGFEGDAAFERDDY